MSLSEISALSPINPLDQIEEVATAQDWAFERADEHELDLVVVGQWGEYPVSLSWRSEVAMLHIAVELDTKVPARRRPAFQELIGLVNERMMLGHFDLWSDENLLVFRYGLLLSGCRGATQGQCEGILQMAVGACDQFYPGFQYLIWADRTPQDALAAVMFETVGQA